MAPLKEKDVFNLISSQGQDQKRESYHHEGFEIKRWQAGRTTGDDRSDRNKNLALRSLGEEEAGPS